MLVSEPLLLAAFVLGMALLGLWFCLWAARKAGIRPLLTGYHSYKKLSYDNPGVERSDGPDGYHSYKKLSYDNWTGVLDTRTSARHRFVFGSKKAARSPWK